MEAFLGLPALKPRTIEAMVCRFEQAESFEQAKVMMEWFEKIDVAAPHIIERLEKAPEANSQVRQTLLVQRRLPDASVLKSRPHS